MIAILHSADRALWVVALAATFAASIFLWALTPGDVPRSEVELERAVRAEPENWVRHAELLEASGRGGHLAERARWYEDWLAEDSDSAPRLPLRQAMLHAALGSVHERAGNWRQARSEYRQAVRLDPANRLYADRLEASEARAGWQRRDTLMLLLLVLLIVAYVALRRRRWMAAAPR